MDSLPLSKEMVNKVMQIILGEKEYERYQADRSVDSSCKTDTMQFHVNCFHENYGPAITIR